VSGPIRLLVHPPAPGARNMAVDEALMEAALGGRVTLRFYRWDPPCLSLGRNQTARGAFDREAARERGIGFVRRPTGGRAVYHDRELTYAVAAPADLWGGLRASYRRINRALLAGLDRLGGARGETRIGARPEWAEGPRAARGGNARAPRPVARACFRDALPGEIVAEGRKLVGSAQFREGGALLQHGSILLHDDQAVVGELRRDRPREGDVPRRAGAGSGASLGELLSRPPESAELVSALREGFEEELRLLVRPGELDRSERAAAAELVSRYRSPEWTWRR